MTLESLIRLRDLFRSMSESHGAKVTDFLVRPGEPSEVVVVVDLEDDVFRTPEQVETDETLAEIEENLRREREQERAAESVLRLSELEKRLRDPGRGLLE